MDKAIGDANNSFATQILSELINKDSNVLFSPWSLFNALAMTFAGASGNTADQMSIALGLKNPGSFDGMLCALKSLQELKSVEYVTANKIWMQTGFDLKSVFLDHLKKHFLSEIGEVDYIKDSEGARQSINSWVEKQTKAKIKDLIPSGVLHALTRLVLTSAVYFKGSWLHEFLKHNTKKMGFQVNLNEPKEVEMMFMMAKKGMMYAEVDNYQVLAMPYTGERLTMNIILPKQGVNLEEMVRSLNSDNNMMSKCINPPPQRESIEIFIPRFKFDFNETYNSILHNMGLKDAFSDLVADFSGMTDAKPGLKVEAVIQKAFIEVNEEGTEAAAATAVMMGLRCAIPTRPPIMFKADRPFIFLIRDKKTNIILFMGKVLDPSK